MTFRIITYLFLFLIGLSCATNNPRLIRKIDNYEYGKIKLEIVNKIDTVDFGNYPTRFIDSLKLTGIEKIGAFYETFVDQNEINQECCRYKNRVIVQWQNMGNSFQRVYSNNINLETCTIINTPIIDYFQNNYDDIKSEYLMRNVIEVKRKWNGSIQYIIGVSCNNKSYRMYCYSNKTNYLIKFGSGEVISPNNLYIEQNMNTKIYNWFSLIKNEQIK